MSIDDNITQSSISAPKAQARSTFLTKTRDRAESDAPSPPAWNAYISNANTTRRRAGLPQSTSPDLLHIILAGETLRGSLLSICEVEGLVALIQPAMKRHYGDRTPDERSFWFPHGWGVKMTDDEFDGLDELLRTTLARLTPLLVVGRGATNDHFLISQMAADLKEVGWQRNQRGAVAGGGWVGVR